jgi:DNA-binding MarR family transcriptional regulator
MDYEKIGRELTAKFFSVAHSGAARDFNRFSKGEMYLLHSLCEHPKPIIPGCLSAKMNISTARTAVILNSLEEKGLIERNIDKGDRRKILVTITDAGRETIRKKQAEMFRTFAETLREMGESDAKEFVRLVSEFFDIMRRIHSENAGMNCEAHSRRRNAAFGLASKRFSHFDRDATNGKEKK